MFKDVYALPGNEVAMKLHDGGEAGCLHGVSGLAASPENSAGAAHNGRSRCRITYFDGDIEIARGMGKAKVREVNTSSSASQRSVRTVSSLHSKVEELQNELNAAKVREAKRHA